MARRKSRWASQAALQAFLKYNPEESGLRELQRTAEGQYDTAVKQAHGTSRGIMGAIDTARPQVQQSFDEAGLRQAQTAGQIRADLQPLGGVTDPIRAAAMLETAQGNRFVSEGRTSALNDLSTRRVAAKEGEAFAINAARNTLVTDLTKVLQRKQDLRQEKGAYAALTTQQLRDTAQKEAQKLDIATAQLEQSDRNSRRTANTSRQNAALSAETSRQNALTRAKGKTSATGAKLLSPDKHLEYQTSIQEIASRAKQLQKHGRSRRDIVDQLQKGRPQQRVTVDPDTGEKLRNPISLPRVPAYPADIRMTAALDVALDGHLSRKTQTKLQHAGFKVSDLNLPTYGQWAKRAKVSRRRQLYVTGR